MVAVAAGFIETPKPLGLGLRLDQCELVSGGSAWSDHVAVYMFLHQDYGVRALRLFLPCPFDLDKQCPRFSEKHPCGKRLNQLHRQYNACTGNNALLDVYCASALGASLQIPRTTCKVAASAFYARNSQIANNCDVLIAFTWSPTSEPTDGGTMNTWSKFRGSPAAKFHFSLGALAAAVPGSQSLGLPAALQSQSRKRVASNCAPCVKARKQQIIATVCVLALPCTMRKRLR